MRLIDGLDRRFKTQGELLSGGTSFPSFMQAQSRLQLDEQKLKAEAAQPPQVLHTNTTTNHASDAPGYGFNGNCYACGAPGHLARNCTRGGDRGQHGYGQQGRGGGNQYGRGGQPMYNHQQPGYGGQNTYGNHGYNGCGRGRGRGRGDFGGRGGPHPGY
nr:glycine-rich cell wall structural protein-like [Lolium perenne]